LIIRCAALPCCGSCPAAEIAALSSCAADMRES
jgi:hypothetical protein